VCLIDYQWSGIALGVTDIIYLLATSASDDFITDIDLHESVLRPYYTTFLEAYATAAALAEAPQYSYDDLVHDFQLAVLDYARWAVSCRLGGETPDKFATRRAAADPNLGSYRRSEQMLRFLLQLVHTYLPAVEKEMAAYMDK
jgi:hypothetical protein